MIFSMRLAGSRFCSSAWTRAHLVRVAVVRLVGRRPSRATDVLPPKARRAEGHGLRVSAKEVWDDALEEGARNCAAILLSRAVLANKGLGDRLLGRGRRFLRTPPRRHHRE